MSIWVGIDPRPPSARVLALQGTETLLKARLRPQPHHPRAAAALFEALALWQGTPVCAALAVGEEEPWCDAGFFPDPGNGPPLWSLAYVSTLRRPRRRDALGGLGDFRDLRQLLLFEDFR